MLFALDKNGKKIHINLTNRKDEYFCPCCNSKLVQKKGDIRIHHFAHPSENYCSDTWHYDMTEWHAGWQDMFPKEYQEIVKKLNGENHRADVLIEENKLVFEFQHSSLSTDEFDERNAFYNKLGYKVIWIFDVEEQYDAGQIELYDEDRNLWYWKHPKRTFDHFDSKNKKVEVYLQIDNFETELLKVVWCTQNNGMSKFITDGNFYDEEILFDMFKKTDDLGNELKLVEIFDRLIELHHKDHTTYYFGCPVSSTHQSGSSSIDIPKEMYAEIMPCSECTYHCDRIKYGDGVCRKRFIDLNLDENLIVKIESKDNYGFINKISYVSADKRIFVDLPTYKPNVSKDIFTLWIENGCSVAIFKNIRTNKYVKITRNPIEQRLKYKKVYGFFSSDRYSFRGDSCELFGVDKNEWILEWFAKEN